MNEDTPSLTRPVTEQRSILAYEFRDDPDRVNGLQPSARPKLAFERYATDRRKNAFEIFSGDVRSIEGSQLFRRLSKHSMVTPSTDPGFENRHSHSLSVANVAERISDGLQLGPTSAKLTRAIALVHDIGHPPFSHEGEEILKQKLASHGVEWDHEHAGLDMLMQHAHKGVSFKGMNLSVAVIEGAAKRFQRYVADEDEKLPFLRKRSSLPESVLKLNEKADLKLDKWNHIEGQIASTSDWVTGLSGDIEDMLMLHLNNRVTGVSNTIKPFTDFFNDVTDHFPPAKALYDNVKQEMADYAQAYGAGKLDKNNYANRMHSLVRTFMTNLETIVVDDIIQNTRRNIAQHAEELKNAGDVRDLPALVAVPSPEMIKHLDSLKNYFQTTLYPKIGREYMDTKKLVGVVFDDFMQGKVEMPDSWGKRFAQLSKAETTAGANVKGIEKEKAMLVADFMTINYSDRDVLWHMQKHHENTFRAIASKAKPAPHIIYPYHADVPNCDIIR